MRSILLIAMALCCARGADDGGAPADAAAYERAFRRRADFYLRRTAAREPAELIAWFNRVPYFQNARGDPHKYALPVVIARVRGDPADPAALRLYRFLMGVDERKDDRGLYHFAVFQRTRLYFQFKERLPDDVVASNRRDARGWFKIMLGDPRSDNHGTENHTYMHRCSAYLWAEELGGTEPGSDLHDEYRFLRAWLIDRTRRLYTVGQGEYDSSTYVGFSLASWANVFDFARDPAIRQVARAAMDWMLVALARKYYHGCQLGPESRGFARTAVGNGPATTVREGEAPIRPALGSLSDWVCWLYFGGSERDVAWDDPRARVGGSPAVVLALSTYRPHPAIRALAAKAFPEPYSSRGSKPVYVGDRGSKDQEYLYLAPHFAMGTLYSPERGLRTSGTILPQTTMFKILLRRDGGIAACGAANGYHGHFPLEGRSPYDQYHQVGAAALNVCWVDADEDARTRRRSCFGYAAAMGEPAAGEPAPGWYCWRYGEAYLGVRPLGGRAERRETVTRAKKGEMVPARAPDHRFLVSPGRLGGWAVQLADAGEFDSLAAFRRALAERCGLDLDCFAEGGEVGFVSLAGDRLRLSHTGEVGGRPIAMIDGEALDFDAPWPVYASPHLRQDQGAGVLLVEAGGHRLRIDVNELPPRYEEEAP